MKRVGPIITYVYNGICIFFFPRRSCLTFFSDALVSSSIEKNSCSPEIILQLMRRLYSGSFACDAISSMIVF